MADDRHTQEHKEAIRKRFETLIALYLNEFTAGIGKEHINHLFLSLEVLHCAVNAYFDDIHRYKTYAGSQFADRHKQAAFTMLWLSRFKPIQLKESAEIDTIYLTINQAYAIYAGLMFLNPGVMDGMTDKFYRHLIYTLTYRKIDGRSLATMLYLMERAASKGIKF